MIKMDKKRSDYRFSHLGLCGLSEVNPWTAKVAMVGFLDLVSRHGWEITALFSSASQL